MSCINNKKKNIIEDVKSIYSSHKCLSKYRKQELCDLLSQDCTTLDGPIWNSNSCYLDSFIVSILHFDNNEIINMILKAKPFVAHPIVSEMKDTLSTIHLTIKDGYSSSCTNLRTLFQKYDRFYDDHVNKIEMIDWKSSQLEPADIIRFFHRCLRIPNELTIKKEIYGSNKTNKILGTKDKELVRESTYKDNFASIIIPIEDLANNSEIFVKHYMPKTKVDTIFTDPSQYWKPSKTKAFKRKLEKITYLSAPYLFIQVSRLYPGIKLNTPLNLSNKIKLKDNKHSLYLKSIIVHHGGDSGGHYTAYIRCKDDWYHYNDMSTGSKIKKFGSFEDISKYREGYILKNCTNLVYA